MATIILTAVGQYLGGPIGAAIGSFIGQEVDYKLFGPKDREGPRLGDLGVQTSSYGNRIPRLYGAVRVSGTVIWATDLRETRRSQSNGKRQPKTNYYSYSASFAVALSSRRISRIGRIWADGKLLRGAAGDFKTSTEFRFYTGAQDQSVDPIIAAEEGVGKAPAYRGLAYAVFEDLQLADFGNRIPSLSFEVFADLADVSVAKIIDDLVGEADVICPTIIKGLIVARGSVRTNLEALKSILPLRISHGAQLRISETPLPMQMLPDIALGSRAGEAAAPKVTQSILPEPALPASLQITYADPARDYQPGVQTLGWIGGGQGEEVLSLPVSLTSEQASQWAWRALHERWASRNQVGVSLPMRFADLKTGQAVALANDANLYRIAALSWEGMAVKARLVSHRPTPDIGLAADAGRHLGALDVQTGQTLLEIIDLPVAAEGIATTPQVVVAACGTQAGWRSANLLQSLDSGASWQEVGATAPSAIMGHAVTILPSGRPWVFDDRSSVDIALPVWMDPLPASDDMALINGAHPALLGDEVILFGAVTPLGNGHYRLTRLVRGWRGTEWAMHTHEMGERFVLLDPDTLAPLAVPPSAVKLRLMASGLADVTPVEAEIVAPGQALRPPSPVHLRPYRQENGDILISWIRRSRDGWRWGDGVDAPLAEEVEGYTLSVAPAGGAPRDYDLSDPNWTYSLNDQQADIVGGAASAAFSVIQKGTYNKSLSTHMVLLLT